MRLGDDIDDHCTRCKRTTDHSVVSMMGDDVLKTRCRTCGAEHKFKNNKGRTKEMTAKDAFDTLLASANAQLGDDKPGKPAKKKKGLATNDTKEH